MKLRFEGELQQLDGPKVTTSSTDPADRVSVRRVLHVLNGAIGGAAKSTVELAQWLADQGVQSTAYCPERVPADDIRELSRTFPGEVVVGPLHLWHRRSRHAPWLRPPAAVREFARSGLLVGSSSAVTRAALAHNVDLVHSATAVSPDGAIAAARLGLAHVWHLRELVGPTGAIRVRGDVDGHAGQRLQRVGTVVANSAATARSWFGAEESGVFVIPNGLKLDDLLELDPPSADGHPIVFGMVANLTGTWKRHLDFVDASAIVAEQDPTARFVIYGKSEEAGRVTAYVTAVRERIASHGLQARMTLEGFEPDVGAIMSAIDVLVHPCERESFGRVFVEASAAARPIVAVLGGAAPEVVQDQRSGLLCPPQDPAALATAMLELIAQPELRQALGQHGRQLAREEFAIDACGRRLLSAYDAAMRSAPPPSAVVPAIVRTLR